MQIDMHFYGVYALARAAGIKPESAYKIAYASQFVDDALEEEMTVLQNHQVAFPIATSHKPMDYQNRKLLEQWNVWVPFHFLPGNKTGGSFYEKMQCLKGTESGPAKKILEHALEYKLKSYGPHLAGVTAHVYADTFAHLGFVGLSTDWNKVEFESIKIIGPHSNYILKYIFNKLENFMNRIRGTIAETVPVGHGAVATYPDRPYLKWEYKREKDGKKISRNNPKDFLDGCEGLYDFFVEFIKDNQAHGESSLRSFGEIRETVKGILEEEGTKEERSEKWKEAIAQNKLFQATEDDKNVEYKEEDWQHHRIKGHLEEKKTLKNCDASHFVHAAWKYRNYVLHDLLPQVGLVTNSEDSS